MFVWADEDQILKIAKSLEDSELGLDTAVSSPLSGKIERESSTVRRAREAIEKIRNLRRHVSSSDEMT